MRDRDLQTGQRTHLTRTPRWRTRRGFTLPEAAIAMAVLLIISSIVSLAVARTLTAQGAVKDARAVSSQVESLLEQAATSPFEDLISGEFARPQACSDDISKSCITVGPQELEVSWQLTLGEDGAGSSLHAASNVNLKALTSLPGGREITLEREVPAPVTGWKANEGVLRVENHGDHYPLGVFLMSSDGRVLDSREFAQSDELLLRAEPADCLSSSPCYLALDEKGQAFTSDYTMTAGDIRGGAGAVILSPNSITTSSLELRERSSLKLDLKAGDSSSLQGAPQQGSVCLWASLTGLSVPLCNIEDQSSVTLDTVTVDGRALGLPRSSSVTFNTDNPGGNCSWVQKGFDGTLGTWVDAAVCTSWTWGTPSTLKTEEGDSAFEGGVMLLKKGVNDATVSWSGEQAIPAAGYSGQETWVKARTLQPCSADGSCTPVSAPEPAACPGGHCSSTITFLPRVTAPNLGSSGLLGVKVKQGGNNFVVSTRDDDGDPYQVRVESLPGVGTLTSGGNPVAPGAALGDFVGAGDVGLEFNSPSGEVNTSFNLRLSSPNGERVITIKLYDNVRPDTFEPLETSLTQETAGVLTFLLKGTDGEPFKDEAVELTPDSALGGKLQASTDSSGIVTFNLNPAAAEAKAYNISLKAGSLVEEETVKVLSTPKSLSASFTDSQVKVSLTDAATKGVEGKVVSAMLYKGAEPLRGGRLNLTSCTTDANGTCSFNIEFEDGVNTQGVGVKLTAGDLSAETAVGGAS